MNAPGPLSRLLRGLGLDDKLPPIPVPQPIEVRPVAIDLRGLNIDDRYEYHGTFRGTEQWTCIDANSYDGPESAMGSGDSKEMALVDLLEKIAPDMEPEPQPLPSHVIHSSPFEPPEHVDAPRQDCDGDDDR